MDRTGQRQSEEALRISEGMLRVAIRAGRHGLYDLDIRTGQAVVNDEYARMLGYDPATFAETNAAWRERLHPEDRDAVYRAYQEYVAGQRDEYRVEFRQRTADGGWRWVLSFGEIVERAEDGTPLRMLGTHTDIQATKDFESRLRESEDRFRRAVEAAPVAIFVQVQGSFAYLNPAACRLFGVAGPDELNGQPVLARFAPADRDAMAERIRRLNVDHQAVAVQAQRILRLDGTEVEAEFSAVPFRFSGRDGALVFAQDATDRLRSERELRAHLEELRRWQTVTLDREGRVRSLKREVNALCQRLDEPPRYPSQLPDGAS